METGETVASETRATFFLGRICGVKVRRGGFPRLTQFKERSAFCQGPASTIFSIGRLTLYMSFKSGGFRSMAILPENTDQVLIYRAAQLASSGTKLQRCAKCESPFLIGGSRAREKKKEGTRFCGEQCRWDYNNARRKKG